MLALRDCSRREKVSLFTLFTAALDALLYRYTGQEDILLGIPLADRDRPELQSVVGFLLHTHVLRTRLSVDLSFRELMMRVQKSVLELYVHRSPPFDQVVSRVRPERNSSYSPLFQVMFIWRDADQQPSFIGLDGLEMELLLSESRTAKFDLTLFLTDGADSFDLDIEYSTDLFDEDRIERMAGHLSTLLEAAAENPDRLVSDLPLLTEAERRQLLVEWNRTALAYPKDQCVHQLFEEQVERAPESVAVTFDGKRLTYRELNQRANQLARHLQRLGVGPDTLVAICLERSLEMVVVLLGILKAGGAYVPLDPSFPSERLAFMLRDLGALLLLTQQRLRDQLKVASPSAKLLCLDSDWKTIATSPDENPESGAGPENLAYVIYTSGSTGQPKAVEIRHRNLANVLCAMAREPGFAPSDKLLAVTTISFDIAALELFLPLVSGGQVEVAPASELSDGFALRRRQEISGATVMQATPATWAMLIEAGWTGNRGLRALSGGEAVAPALADELLTRTKELWNVYGPTETTIWSSLGRIGTGQRITIGRPIANTLFYVVDKAGHPLPVGVPGELLIGGDGLARGYLRRPELTAEKFIANPFSRDPSARLYRTGDLVRRLSGGAIEFLGRLDHQVKIRGFRIELGEIESALAELPGVREAVALAREDEPGDKRLVAYLAKDGEPPKDSELRGMLRAKLPEYMIPSAFVVLDRFPLTLNEKVDRKALPRPDLQSSNPTEFTPPQTETQKTLTDIWRQVLGLARVGLHDNFFELGGHSLLAVRVIGKINKLLDVDLTVLTVYQNQTVEQLAKAIDQKRYLGPGLRLAPLRSGHAGLPIYLIGPGAVEYRIAQSISGDRSICLFNTFEWHRAISVESCEAVPTIGQLGEICGAAVHAHAGQTPCVIMGYCVDGKIAVEAAHALERAGGSVALVVLIDAVMDGGGRTRGPALRSLRWIWRRAETANDTRHVGGLGTSLGQTAQVFLWLLAQAPHVVRSRINDLKQRRVQNGQMLSPYFDNKGAPLEWNVVIQSLVAAGRSFRPSPVEAPGVLIRVKVPAEERLPGFDVTRGWGNLFPQGFDVVEIPGDHYDIVYEKNFEALTQNINAVLHRYAVVSAAENHQKARPSLSAFREVQLSASDL